MLAQGFVAAQTGNVGQGTHFCYYDMVAAMGHYTELVHLDLDFRKVFDSIARNDLAKPANA